MKPALGYIYDLRFSIAFVFENYILGAAVAAELKRISGGNIPPVRNFFDSGVKT